LDQEFEKIGEGTKDKNNLLTKKELDRYWESVNN
jgi:hypothetical protein